MRLLVVWAAAGAGEGAQAIRHPGNEATRQSRAVPGPVRRGDTPALLRILEPLDQMVKW